jgi:anti-anti-sigma factor
VEIATGQVGEALEVRVSGRLDAYWAEHLTRTLDDAVHGGAHRIRINMKDVVYMSSVGVRVLLKFYKQLQRINGSLAVSEPSEAVQTVLELAGLQMLLAAATTGAAVAEQADRQHAARRVETTAAVFEVFEVAAEASLTCRVVGQPELLRCSAFTAAHCRRVTFSADVMGVGLGAFGGDFAECQGRFGEFLGAAGTAAYLPTDGTTGPDYLVTAGAFVPQLSVLYALVCAGAFARLVRFEARPDKGSIGLSELAATALDLAAADVVGVVMVAESAGLMGVTLRRSPAAADAGTEPFAFPAIRDWLSFAPERAHARGLALVVGVVARSVDAPLGPLLRSLGKAPAPAGHFHAAAFSYRPLQKGYVELGPAVSTLFEAEKLQGVLHLLNDDRRFSGAGESEFVRGACWVSPISSIVAER